MFKPILNDLQEIQLESSAQVVHVLSCVFEFCILKCLIHLLCFLIFTLCFLILPLFFLILPLPFLILHLFLLKMPLFYLIRVLGCKIRENKGKFRKAVVCPPAHISTTTL